VEADSTGFKPLGEKIGSYARPTAAYLASLNPGKSKGVAKGKAKAKANGQSAKAADVEVGEDSEDAVVYEMYRVSFRVWPSAMHKRSSGIGR